MDESGEAVNTVGGEGQPAVNEVVKTVETEVQPAVGEVTKTVAPEGEVPQNIVQPQNHSSRKLKMVAIVSTITILFLGLIIVYFVFMYNPKNEGPDFNNENIPGIAIEEEYAEKVGNCLGEGSQDTDCKMLFSYNPDPNKCNGLGELEDDCLYKMASMNYNPEICSEINDADLRDKCGRTSYEATGGFYG